MQQLQSVFSAMVLLTAFLRMIAEPSRSVQTRRHCLVDQKAVPVISGGARLPRGPAWLRL